MPINTVKIQCKQCGRQADSHTFILDPVYKRMVCAECVKDRKARAAMELRRTQAVAQAAQKAAEPPKPAGWDQDDVELERLAKLKKEQAPKPKLERIDDNRVKMACTKCGYRFIYNLIHQNPRYCPYCGKEVEKVR